MKTTWLFSLLSAAVISASAQVSQKEVKLLGINSGLDKDVAIIEVRTPPKSREDVRQVKIHGTNYTFRTPPEPRTDDFMLGAGREMNGVVVLKIEPTEGSVKVKVDGEEQTLVLEMNSSGSSTNVVESSSPVIHLRSVPLGVAISLYAHYRNRTVMQYPQLGNPTFSLDVNPRSKEEAAAIFEKMFNEQNIATIPDGEHFVMVVPFALTNTVNPRSAALSSTNSLIPQGSINFWNAPLPLVLSAYADYMQKEVVNLHDGNLPYDSTFTFVQTTPLSKEEICYALETQFEWRNVRIVPDGEKWKAERVPASK